MKTQEDLYYPHPLVQDILWATLHKFVEPLLLHWPGSMLREKALRTAMEHIHYEDENTRSGIWNKCEREGVSSHPFNSLRERSHCNAADAEVVGACSGTSYSQSDIKLDPYEEEGLLGGALQSGRAVYISANLRNKAQVVIENWCCSCS